MVLKIDGEKKMVAVTIGKTDIIYLKGNGMNRSKFFRQAVQAHKDGKFDYDYMLD